MKNTFVLFLFLALSSYSLTSSARLSESEQDQVRTAIQSGELAVIDRLRLGGLNFEEADVDIDQFAQMAADKNSPVLAEEGLTLTRVAGDYFRGGRCGNMSGCFCSDGHKVPWNASCSYGRGKPVTKAKPRCVTIDGLGPFCN